MTSHEPASPQKDADAPGPRAAAPTASHDAVVGGVSAGWLDHDLLAHPANAGVRTLALRRAQQSDGNAVVQRIVSRGPAARVQRQCACGGTCDVCHATTGGGPVEEEHGPMIQAKSAGGVPANVPPDGVIPPGAGAPLPDDTRQILESHFDADLAPVRIHTDAPAAASAAALGAEAYTTGSDIYFAAGRYQPDTAAGVKLLAHEVTHTIQQKTDAADAVQTSMQVSEPGDPEELEAEAAATAFVRGEPVSVGPSAATGRPLARFGFAGPRAVAPGAAFPTAVPETLDEVVDKILNALRGITTSEDSHMILGRFQGRDAATVQAILDGLKAKAPQYGSDAAHLFEWLLGDMTAGDRQSLRRLLASLGVLDDLAADTANQIKQLGGRVGNLFGLATGSDNTAIYSIFTLLGPRLDAFLRKLQTALGVSDPVFSLELFGKFNEETAHQLWELFLKQGGTVAQKLATDHTVIAIFWLLQPGATAGDGAAVAWRFRKTPDELRKLVFDQVNDRLRVRNTTAEAVMLQVFDRLDYEEVRGMPGVVRARQDRSAGPGSRSSHSTRNADGQPRK